jgi:hypothetical protein
MDEKFDGEIKKVAHEKCKRGNDFVRVLNYCPVKLQNTCSVPGKGVRFCGARTSVKILC